MTQPKETVVAPKVHNRGGPRPNSGRPELGELAWKRQRAINTYLTPEQKTWVEAMAKARGISVSEAFRNIIAEAMTTAKRSA